VVSGQGLTRGVVKNIVTNGKDSKLALRQGLRELFGSCYDARIPVTVNPGPSKFNTLVTTWLEARIPVTVNPDP